MNLNTTASIESLELIKDVGHSTHVFFGKNSEFKLELPKGKILLVTSPSIDSVFLKHFVSYYEDLGVTFVNADKSSGEPWSKDIDESFSKISGPISGVVGIGGGSVLDFAKALAILISNKGAITEFEFGDSEIKEVSPLWLIPTTCGSGSEVTQYCVINNSVTGRKFTLANDALKPKQTAINPEQLKFIPNYVRLETGLDAFIHCLEALLNFNREVKLDPISEEGIRIAYRALPKAAKGDSSIELLEQLATLSLYGGTSITYSRTGLIHTLSVAFAPFMKMSHGLLNANLLYYALKFSLPYYKGRLKNICSIMFGQNITSDEDALEKLLLWLETVIGKNEFFIEKSLNNEQENIVNRVLQDKGLSSVTYGDINKKLISEIVSRIINETR